MTDVPRRLAAALVALALVGSAAAQSARLTVEPAGEQRFDITTGETVLPSGGTIVDQETGVALQAGWIRFEEGAFIEAEDASAEGDFGRFEAPRLRIDLEAGTLRATEGVTLQRGELEVRAEVLRYVASEDAVRFEQAEGVSPAFEARALLLDLRSGDALLLGPYAYQGDPFTLEDAREEGRLQLRWHEAEAEETAGGYDARSEVEPELLARFEPLL